jgi:hypothetical protein
VIAFFFLATTPPSCWVTWRIAYKRGRADQKAWQTTFARALAESDPLHDVEAARQERAKARTAELHALLGLKPEPWGAPVSPWCARRIASQQADRDVIDLRDGA